MEVNSSKGFFISCKIFEPKILNDIDIETAGTITQKYTADSTQCLITYGLMIKLTIKTAHSNYEHKMRAQSFLFVMDDSQSNLYYNILYQCGHGENMLSDLWPTMHRV